MRAVAPRDIILTPEAIVDCGRVWADLPRARKRPKNEKDTEEQEKRMDEAVKNPLLNPMVCDAAKMFGRKPGSKDEGHGNGTKLIVVSGTWDVLHPDIVLFVEKCEKYLNARTAVPSVPDSSPYSEKLVYIEGEKMTHCFPVGWAYGHELRKGAEVVVEELLRG